MEKKKIVVKEVNVSRCPKTMSGDHIWAKLGGNDPQIAGYMICVACGLVNDLPIDKESKEG